MSTSSTKCPMTVQGAALLREELHHLKTVARPQVIQAIAEARAHGDLKENAEYHAAKEQQGFIEGRIRSLEAKLSHAQVIDVTALPPRNKVVFGVTVDLEPVESGQVIRYQIVGEDEADLKQGKISYSSPIARALMGKEPGDTVDVQAPGGIQTYEVVGLHYLGE